MKKYLMVFCAMLFAISALSDGYYSWNDSSTGITWSYNITDGSASIGTRYMYEPAIQSSTKGAVIIPSSLGGYPVTSIGDYAFYTCSGLTSVTIPSSVTNIGNSAFFNCSGFASVTIPSSVTSIDSSAFEGCAGLKILTIPEGVMSIGSSAFCNCIGLKSVTIPPSVTSIGPSAFSGCTNMSEYVIHENNPNYRSVNGLLLTKDGTTLVNSINDDVTIPSSVTNIGRSAFSCCNALTSVTIPEGVTSIGDYAFLYCSGLKSVTIPEGVMSIGRSAFSSCSALTNVTIPSSVTSIGSAAFSSCGALTSVTITEGVKSIGDYAFYSCRGLTNATIPLSVTNISSYAFSGCSGLTSVTIPPGVTSIGSAAFWVCSGLTNVTISEGVKNIGQDAFLQCSGLKSVTIPSSVTSIGNGAFSGCSGLTSATVPGWKCGIDFSKVTHLVIAEGTTNIQSSAFSGCTALTSVTIPPSVTSIGDGAFDGCSGITSVTVPGWKCEIDFSKVTHLVIAEGTTNIQSSAFSGCTALTSVTIPASVTSIGDGAFSGCSGLTSVTILSSVTSIVSSPCYTTPSFYGCSAIKHVTMPSQFKVSGVFPSALQSIESVTITDGSYYITSQAFSNCSSLKTVDVPASVVWIEDEAFSRCASLQNVTYAGNSPAFGSDVYQYTPITMTSTLTPGTFGWNGDFTTNMPSAWNGRRVIVSDRSGGGSDVPGILPGPASGCITFIATNVVLHYVVNSIMPERAMPVSMDTGFVNIITEVKSSGAVSVPETWKGNFAGYEEKFGTDFVKSLMKPTGKYDGAGNALLVWQDYVAGTNPTDAEDVFAASITIVDGQPVISYSPELSAEEAALRKYVTWGKVNLQDKDWVEVTPGNEGLYHFFKISVEMK